MESTLSRIKRFIDFKGINISTFERNVGYSNGGFSVQLKNNRTIGSDKIEKILISYPEINADWLITGQGSMIKDKRDYNNYVSEADVGYGPPTHKIPLLPVSAFAGKGLKCYMDLTLEHYYMIPEFKSASFLIPVIGDSMAPKFLHGDMVACRLLTTRLYDQYGKDFVIYTESQGLLLKKLKPSKKEGYLSLISYNNDYDPFDVPITDIVDIAMVIGMIRSL